MKSVTYLTVACLTVALMFSLVGCTSSVQDVVEEGVVEENGVVENSFPTEPIVLIVPAAAGGGGDTHARQLAEAASKHSPVPIVVENFVGGGGANAMSQVFKRPHDGHTVFHVTTSVIVSNPYLVDMPYEYSDFKGVLKTQADATVLYVKADDVASVGELIVEAKSGDVVFGGYAVGSMDHIASYILADEAGFELEYVPFDSGSDALVAILGGHIRAGFTQYSDLIGPIESGDVKVLAVAADERYENLPDIPTMKEEGISIPNLENWRGWMVPTTVPEENVKILHDIFKKAIEEDSFRQYTSKNNLANVYLGLDDFTKSVEEQSLNMGELLKDIGMID